MSVSWNGSNTVTFPGKLTEAGREFYEEMYRAAKEADEKRAPTPDPWATRVIESAVPPVFRGADIERVEDYVSGQTIYRIRQLVAAQVAVSDSRNDTG